MQSFRWPVLNKSGYHFSTFKKPLAMVFVLLCMTFAAVAKEALKPDVKVSRFWSDYEPQSKMQVNHDQWQGVLNRYLDDVHPSGINLFDYGAVTPEDRQVLKDYLTYLQLLEPRQLNFNEAKAFWLNLYNAALVDDILDEFENKPIESVREIRSGAFKPLPWTRDAVEILFQKMSLSDIEHNIIRPVFKDPRVHFVLAKGSLGGGDLLKTAFDGDNNEELLTKAETDFLNHDRCIFITDDGRAKLNSIFDWYAKDFASTRAQLITYISERVSDEAKVSILLSDDIRFDYDWALNGK